MRSVLMLVLVAACAVAAPPTPPATVRPPVVSHSSITLTGPAAGGTRTISLPFMNNFADKGDWYVTPTDAHAAFFLADAFASREGRMDLLLNGKQTAFPLNHDNNKNFGHKTDQWFSVYLGSAQKSTYFTLDRDDVVTITITQMDMLNLEATFAGTVTQAPLPSTNGHEAFRVKVSGVISLHRASAPPPISAGNYTDCDPIVHDWLNEAENRAPSECEVKFDQYVRTTFGKAFQPTISAFEAQQWQARKSPNPGTLQAVARGSEKTPYVLGFAGANLGLELTMNPSDPQYQRRKAAADAPDPTLVKEMDLMKQGKYAEAQAMEKARKPNNSFGEFRDNTQIGVSPVINLAEMSKLNFHGAYAATPLPGGGMMLYLPDAQPGGGGSEGQAMTYVLLGPWGPPRAASLDGDATQVTVKARMNPAAPRLSVQTVSVSFRCSRELAQKMIQAVDWSTLRALIASQ